MIISRDKVIFGEVLVGEKRQKDSYINDFLNDLLGDHIRCLMEKIEEKNVQNKFSKKEICKILEKELKKIDCYVIKYTISDVLESRWDDFNLCRSIIRTRLDDVKYFEVDLEIYVRDTNKPKEFLFSKNFKLLNLTTTKYKGEIK